MPAKFCSWCMWHSFGSTREQWRSCSAHVSWSAFVDPANAIVSPTAQVVALVGVAIVTVGGLPTVIVLVAVPVRPVGSVTRRRTITRPRFV